MSTTRPKLSVAGVLAASVLLISALLVPHVADAKSKPSRQTGALVKKNAKSAAAKSRAGQAFAKALARKHGKKRKKARKPARQTQDVTPAAQRSDLLFGAHVDGDVYTGNLAKTDALEQRLGRRIAISQWYQNWGGGEWIRQVHPDLIKAVTDSGRIPLITWEPWSPENFGKAQSEFSLDNIASGRYDSYIDEWANGLRDAGSTIYLRTMHEMNGGWYPWGTGVNGNTAEKYKRAWRHIVDRFRAAGASNVKFVWCPLVDSVPDKPGNQIEDYYPGSDYVDVLSLDGYNWGTNKADHGGWRSFDQVFGRAYDKLTKLGSQPIWIAEVGSAPEGGSKAAWIKDMFKSAAKMKQLAAIVWFDVDKEEDWRAAPDDAVAAAFRG